MSGSPDDVIVEFGPRAGTGIPPQWAFVVHHQGVVVAQMSGPRLLVLETLERFVALFREESAPA